MAAILRKPNRGGFEGNPLIWSKVKAGDKGILTEGIPHQRCTRGGNASVPRQGEFEMGIKKVWFTAAALVAGISLLAAPVLAAGLRLAW